MANLDVVTQEKTRLCTFTIEENYYGVDIDSIQEVSSELVFTPIFHAPTEIEGFSNMRGEIYLVANLKAMLGFEKSDHKSCNRVLYMKNKIGENFGILVDQVSDVLEVDNKTLEDNESTDSINDLCQQVCFVEGKVIAIVNAKNILNNIHLNRGGLK